MEQKAKISEVFKSIQGEGLYQGCQQIFVRFSGCNLNCGYCDTDIKSGIELTVEGVINQIEQFSDYHSISLTGGEPLLQINFLQQLLPELKKRGKKTYLETNGTLFHNLRSIISWVDIVAMDFKLSSSTGMKDFWFAHREFFKVAKAGEVFIKTVIGPRTRIEDLRIALAIIKEIKKDVFLILQPENPYEEDLKEKLAYFERICLRNSINIKIISQLHKKLGIK